MRNITRAFPFLLVIILIAGCSASHEASSVETFDVSWIVGELEDSGLQIDTRGAASLSRRSIASSRLLLNNRDIVEIHEFESEGEAYEAGQFLVSASQSRDVYLKGSLLVVHFVNPGSGVRPVLFELLGTTL